MTRLALLGRDRRSVDLDLCRPCRAIWFDALESVRLSGLGWTLLLRRLAALPPTPPGFAAAGSMRCEPCKLPLAPLRNANRYGRFAAQQCPGCLGQLQNHGMLLANRGLFRPLLERERATLAAEGRPLECLHCGAGLEGGADHCGYCRSPAVVIDMPRLASALQEEESAGRASATPAPLIAWSCRGCGQSLDPTVQTECRGCRHPVLVPSLRELGPLLDAVEAKLRAPVLHRPDTTVARLSAAAGRVYAADAASQSPGLLSRVRKSAFWFAPVLLLVWLGHSAMRPAGTDSGTLAECLLGDCGTPLPANWPALAPVAKGQCPDVSGTFQPTDDDVLATLLGVAARGDSIELSRDAAGVLGIALRGEPAAGPDATRSAIKGRESYACEDGWLQMRSPAPFAPFRRWAERDEPHVASSINLRKNLAGDLVVRKDRSGTRGMAVWCGDFCKVLPLPFSQKTRNEWVLWTLNTPEKQAEAVAAAGDPDTAQGGAVRKLTKRLPPGSRVVSVKPMASGDVLVQFATVQAIGRIELEETLLSGADVQGRIESVDKKPGAGSDVSISLHVAKPKTQASILEEQRVVEERAAKAALLKSHTQAFLRLLPKGGQLGNLTWQGDGLLAEVRLSKDQTVESFVITVHTSEHFTETSIRSVEDNTSGGRTVRLTLRAR
ncbi:MAG: hypothetical protein ABL916_12735 [Burkholderiaceae bacterium]